MPSTASASKFLTADRITDAFLNDGRRFVSAIGDPAMTLTQGDAALYVCNVAEPTLNGVVTVRISATSADVESLLEAVRATGLPHSLNVRPGCRQEILDLVKSRGMVEGEALPLMAMGRSLEALQRVTDSTALAIRVLDATEARVHYSVAAEGYEAPIEMFEALVPPAAMALPGLRVYVGEVDGVPVTTAIGSTAGEFVGIFNVATPARFRGRGYGAAITARAVVDGFESGASVAYLQSSPMGLKVYERLGFRTLETWSVWISGPPSHS